MKYLGSKSRSGSVASALLIGAGAVAVALGAMNFVTSAQKDRQGAANEAEAHLVNDMVMSRVGQVIASTAVLCSETRKSCFWNEKQPIQQSEFNITRPSQDGPAYSFNMSTCVPSFDKDISFSKCKSNSSSRVSIRLVDMAGLTASNLVATGAKTADDKDQFAALVSVETQLLNNPGKKLALTAVIRRPRPLVRIEATSGVCKPTCYVSSTQSSTDPLGTKTQDFCYGRIKVTNNAAGNTTTKANVKYTVFNDGPGYLYRFQINREYVPATSNFKGYNPAIPKTSIYDSDNDERISGRNGNRLGLAPGESITIDDSGIPCSDDQTTQVVVSQVVYADVHNHAYDGGGVWSVSASTRQLSTNSRPSGTAKYAFDKVEPDNALLLDGSASTVPATQTLTTLSEVILVNTGMN